MIRPGAWALLALAVAAAPLQAQRKGADAAAPSRWHLAGNQGSYCIWYLADPAVAKGMVPPGVTLTPAGSAASLHPMVKRYVDDEPRFAQWIPGVVCMAFYDTLTADSKTIARARRDRPVLVVLSGISAKGALGVSDADYYLLDMVTDQAPIRGAGDEVGLDIGSLDWSSRVRIEGEDPNVSFDLDKTQIVWSGHPIGGNDVEMTRSLSFGYGGRRKTAWLVRFEMNPEHAQLTVGSLSVEGKGDLATALKSSPLRALGPETLGGTADLTFLNETHH